jgi:hypothetical protein
VLREALFIAADHARRLAPALAARYHRLMVQAGKHHNSALCHIATALLTRIVACWRRGEPYTIRDTDGRPITHAEGRRIIAERYQVPNDLRDKRCATTSWQRPHSDEPVKQGVAQRSVTGGPPSPYRQQPGLTPIRNSTVSSSPAGIPGPSRWRYCSSGCAVTMASPTG